MHIQIWIQWIRISKKGQIFTSGAAPARHFSLYSEGVKPVYRLKCDEK